MSESSTAAPAETERPAPRGGLSLRLRFLILFFMIFLGGAAAGYGVIAWFTQDVVRTLSGWFAEKNVLYEKSKVLQLMLREVVLARKMASSPVLKAWVNNEFNAQARARAMAELEDYRAFFRSKSYFFAIESSGNYYFNDGAGGQDVRQPRYTLKESIPKDGWFFATLRQVDDYQLNVDTDRHLKVTKVWVNTVLRDGGERRAVIGTGVDLSDFIGSVIGNTRPGITNLLFDHSGAIQAHQDVSKIDFASIAKAQRNERQKTIFDLVEAQDERVALATAIEQLAAGNGDTRTLHLTVQGRGHVAGITYLNDIRWFLVTLTDPEAAEKQHYVTTVATVMILALAITLLFAGIAFDRMVLCRLAAFDAAAHQIASGNYTVSLPASRQDELGRLGSTLQDMARRMHTNTAQLEQQVAQRTQVLERLAYADFLTGLLNRRGIIDRLEMERNRLGREHGRLGIIIIDLDYFKGINDLHGHDAGDRALVHVANVIRGVMRSYDVCARWGGEEFLVIVPGAPSEEVLTATAEKLRSGIESQPFTVADAKIVLTASVGCYLACPEESVDAMLKAADDALYQAKSAGRNRVVATRPISRSGSSRA